VMYFSHAGGIEVEENWDTVQSIDIPLNRKDDINQFLSEWFPTANERIITFIADLYRFFVEFGFVYLEVNPFTFDVIGNVICLDMVARVDDSEWFRQRKHWQDLAFPHPFGPEKTEGEQYIEKLDAETGASLKFRILNPEGRIWLLTSGGGASVIIADTLADLGFAGEIGNYGECSGNPDRDNTKAYTGVLLDTMLANSKKWKYLIIAGAIANFTHIDRTFAGIIDAFRDRIENMRKQDIHILVRRWGINDTAWLELMKKSCEELWIPCEIADGSVYMTDILTKIIL
jgi:ATP-citrate lyase beta-subunit